MASKPKNYDDEATYDVKLARIAVFRGVQLLPLPVHEMTGAAINEIVSVEGEDVVDFANPR